ncbi:MAG: hypothetical protein ACRYFZ_12210 [Janthinobacterium lividum]
MHFLLLWVFLSAPNQADGYDFSCLEKMRFDGAVEQNYAYSCSQSHGIYSSSYTKFYSENVKCLLDIYRLYDPSVKGDCYLLYNADEGGFVDDMRFNSGPLNPKTKPFSYKKSCTPALEKIRASYLKWVQLLKRDGIQQLRQQHISPLSGTGFVWRATAS